MTEKPEPDFEDLATAALNNTGIDTTDRAARAAMDMAAVMIWPPWHDSLQLIEAEPDKSQMLVLRNVPSDEVMIESKTF